jgi:hypothetical protein
MWRGESGTEQQVERVREILRRVPREPQELGRRSRSVHSPLGLRDRVRPAQAELKYLRNSEYGTKVLTKSPGATVHTE